MQNVAAFELVSQNYLPTVIGSSASIAEVFGEHVKRSANLNAFNILQDRSDCDPTLPSSMVDFSFNRLRLVFYTFRKSPKLGS